MVIQGLGNRKYEYRHITGIPDIFQRILREHYISL